jgi:hypothetical protein
MFLVAVTCRFNIKTTSKTYTHRYFYCDHDKYPYGRVIMPYDKDARVTARGDHKCGDCVREDVKKSLSLFGGGNS